MAIKGLFKSMGAEAWGHSISELLRQLPETMKPDKEILQMARRLDRMYIPARYPNGFPSGTPREMFDETSAREAIEIAKSILQFCKSKMAKD